jgi:DNA-binding protein YbaB
MSDSPFLAAAERLREAAARAGVDPLEHLREGVSGTSADGSVQVWVNALGQVQRTRIRSRTVLEGDEQRLAQAFTQAAAAATRAVAELVTPEALRQRIAELDETARSTPESTLHRDRNSW